MNTVGMSYDKGYLVGGGKRLNDSQNEPSASGQKSPSSNQA
ncbi:MAG: hypothetical protein AB4352_29590 [Hormoscilla sp.]